MQEFEVNILEIDKESLIRKVISLGATKIFDGEIYAEFFRNKDWKDLRLRKIWNQNLLTYKEKIHSDWLKSCYEHEIAFSNYEELAILLPLIWFEKYWEKSKIRITYKLENIIYDFDKPKKIPWYVEIESDNKEDVQKWVELIWYKMSETNTMLATEIEDYYNGSEN